MAFRQHKRFVRSLVSVSLRANIFQIISLSKVIFLLGEVVESITQCFGLNFTRSRMCGRFKHVNPSLNDAYHGDFNKIIDLNDQNVHNEMQKQASAR